MSIILMTTLFYKAWILQGAIWRWSLLGINGLMSKTTTLHLHHAIFINFFAIPAKLHLSVWEWEQQLRKILQSLSELGHGPLSSATT